MFSEFLRGDYLLGLFRLLTRNELEVLRIGAVNVMVLLRLRPCFLRPWLRLWCDGRLEPSIFPLQKEKLTKITHELELEQQKMSVVYQNQKDSFRECSGRIAQRNGGNRTQHRRGRRLASYTSAIR
jgi:hypothetical protein